MVSVNAAEFFFAVVAVFGATGIIYAWYSWIYGLDDGYQESIRKRTKKRRAVKKVVSPQAEKKQNEG